MSIRTLLITTGVLASALFANDFFEIEPNNTKAEATMVDCLQPGDHIYAWTGCAPSDPAEIFRVRVCDEPDGLTVSSLIVGQWTDDNRQAKILGIGQSNGVPQPQIPTTLQRAFFVGGNDELLQWYGFGLREELYVDLGADTDCRGSSNALHEHHSFFAQSMGAPLQPGLVSFSTQNTFDDTALWIFDDEFHALPDYGNDDDPGSSLGQSFLTREFAPGTYYLALADGGLTTHQPAPLDDARRDGDLLDFPAVVNTSSSVGITLRCDVSDGSTLVNLVATKTQPFEIFWFRFEVAGTDAVRSFCTGDGNWTSCPCGNETQGDRRRGCQNSTGYGALLTANGSNRLSSDDQQVYLEAAPPTQAAVLFGSLNPAAGGVGTTLGDGILCLAPPLVRYGLVFMDGSGRAQWGPGLHALGGWAAGSTVFFQAAYRDPGGPCLFNFNFSQGLAIRLEP